MRDVTSPGRKGLQHIIKNGITSWSIPVMKLKIGARTMKICAYAMVHWPESMATIFWEKLLCPMMLSDSILPLWNADASWAGKLREEAGIYYANIVCLWQPG